MTDKKTKRFEPGRLGQSGQGKKGFLRFHISRIIDILRFVKQIAWKREGDDSSKDLKKGRIQMEWTFANLIIQTMAGLIGSNIAAAAAHEHRFGFWGHSLVGLVTGALAGIFLQKYASTVVTADGSLNDPTHVQIFAAQVLTGAVTGAIAMMATGFIIKERSQSD